MVVFIYGGNFQNSFDLTRLFQKSSKQTKAFPKNIDFNRNANICCQQNVHIFILHAQFSPQEKRFPHKHITNMRVCEAH